MIFIHHGGVLSQGITNGNKVSGLIIRIAYQKTLFILMMCFDRSNAVLLIQCKIDDTAGCISQLDQMITLIIDQLYHKTSVVLQSYRLVGVLLQLCKRIRELLVVII